MPVFPKRLGLALATIGAFALAAPLTAQMENMAKPGARDASRVTGGTYAADPAHTMVGWRVDHLGITPYFGMFGNVSGTLVLDPKRLATSKVDIVIPVGEVTTANADLTQHLLKAPDKAGARPDFFGTAPKPAHFVSTAVSVVGPPAKGKARVTGNLTLNGVTRPVTLDVDFYGAAQLPKEMGGGEQVGFEARATIKRSEFGLGMGLPLVSDEVQLDIVAAFAKAPPQPAPPPLPSANDESCVAQRLGIFIGKAATADIIARIRGVVGERPIRTIRPGDAVTMDYAPARLNVELDEAGAIRRFRCG